MVPGSSMRQQCDRLATVPVTVGSDGDGDK